MAGNFISTWFENDKKRKKARQDRQREHELTQYSICAQPQNSKLHQKTQ